MNSHNSNVNLQKLVLVGPIAPYTSGIARYNDNLYAALKKQKNISVEAVSFKTLYPKFLFPGKEITNIKEANTTSDTKYLLSCYNPISWYKTYKHISKSKTNVVLITWWTLFWQPWLAFIAMMLRSNRIKVIFLCHNLYDHDSKSFMVKLSKMFLRQADAYVVHDTEEYNELSNWSDNNILKRYLPVKEVVDTHTANKMQKQGRLELLFFGIIRPYKGLDVLLEALKQLQDKDLYVSIVGEPWMNKDELKIKIAGFNIPNIEMKLEFVSEAVARDYFNKADVVVLPYLSATGSAVAAQAYEYGKPVIASRVGGFKDVVIEGKTGWLFEPGDSEELANIIKKLDRPKTSSTKKNVDKFVKDNSWDNFAKKVITFCTE